MIARIWRGAVSHDDRDRYAEYMRGTGVKEYAETSGNRAVLMLRRDDGHRTEFVMVTLWESWDAIRAFAGDDVERAVFYPEDDAFLIERDLTATPVDLHARGHEGLRGPFRRRVPDARLRRRRQPRARAARDRPSVVLLAGRE